MLRPYVAGDDFEVWYMSREMCDARPFNPEGYRIEEPGWYVTDLHTNDYYGPYLKVQMACAAMDDLVKRAETAVNEVSHNIGG